MGPEVAYVIPFLDLQTVRRRSDIDRTVVPALKPAEQWLAQVQTVLDCAIISETGAVEDRAGGHG